jgi:hypothetical protein
MKSITTLAVVALLATVSVANAQTSKSTNKAAPTDKIVDECAPKQAANAEVISKAQAAKTAAERKKILKAAIDADPANAVCLIDMAMQAQLALNTNIQPAAGPDQSGPDISDGTNPPAENPNQLNVPTNAPASSPAAPGGSSGSPEA